MITSKIKWKSFLPETIKELLQYLTQNSVRTYFDYGQNIVTIIIILAEKKEWGWIYTATSIELLRKTSGHRFKFIWMFFYLLTEDATVHLFYIYECTDDSGFDQFDQLIYLGWCFLRRKGFDSWHFLITVILYVCVFVFWRKEAILSPLLHFWFVFL